MKKVSRGWLIIIATVVVVLGLIRYYAVMEDVSNFIYKKVEVKLLDCFLNDAENDADKLLREANRLPQEFKKLLIINIKSLRSIKLAEGRFIEDTRPGQYRQWFLTLVGTDQKQFRLSSLPYAHRRYPTTVHCDFKDYYCHFTDFNHLKRVAERCDLTKELLVEDLKEVLEKANELLPDFLEYQGRLRSCRQQIRTILQGPLRDPLRNMFSSINKCQSALELYLQLQDMYDATFDIEEDILPHKLHHEYFAGCKPFEGDMVKLYQSFFRTKMERIEGIKCRVLEIGEAVD